ncbi:unnamed protein product [Trifolium pratense]|uniref:Uncharacterized protein n=1 Tax=Trifolium pratense TaxID=57577 RepID=A0ACB0KHJ7_TRIPR|nr:unnamed protein product [Trifolium pratense]
MKLVMVLLELLCWLDLLQLGGNWFLSDQLKSNLSPLSKVNNETIMMSDAGLLSNTLALDAIHDIVPSHVINVTALFLCLLYLVNDPKVVYGVRLKCCKMSYEPSFA